MRHVPRRPPAAFTLVELLSVLFVLSLLAVMSVRSLGVVLDSREQMARDAEKWRGLALFFERFERDIHLAMPAWCCRRGRGLPEQPHSRAWNSTVSPRRPKRMGRDGSLMY